MNASQLLDDFYFPRAICEQWTKRPDLRALRTHNLYMPDYAGEAGTHTAACIRLKSSLLLGDWEGRNTNKGRRQGHVLHVRKSSPPSAVMMNWITTWLSWTDSAVRAAHAAVSRASRIRTYCAEYHWARNRLIILFWHLDGPHNV